MNSLKLLSTLVMFIVFTAQDLLAVNLDFATNDTLICENQRVTLRNTTENKEDYFDKYDFYWELPNKDEGAREYTFITNFDKNNIGDGMVTLKLIDKNTKKIEATLTKKLNIIFRERPDVTISSSHDKNGKLSVCRGVNFTLEATATNQELIDQYVWQIGITPPELGNPIALLSDAIGTTKNADLTLRIQDIYGCSHIYTKPKYVTVKEEAAINPIITIWTENTPNPPKSYLKICEEETEYTIKFAPPASSLTTIESFVWTLPDGTQNTKDKTIKGTLSGFGDKRFSLKVIDSQGCESSNTPATVSLVDITKAIDFRATNAETKKEAKLEEINCYGKYFFSPTTNLETAEWDTDGDGVYDQITKTTSEVEYMTTTNITLKGKISGEGCVGTTTKQLKLEKKAEITLEVEPKNACKKTTFSYTVKSNLADFTVISKIESLDTSLTNKAFNITYGEGVHTVSFTPQTAAGCPIAPSTVTVEVAIPTVNLYKNEPNNHCVPHHISYTDTLNYSPKTFKDSVVMYRWDYDNDGIVDYESPTAATAPLEYIYTKKGVYTTVLNVEVGLGCIATKKDSTRVGIQYDLVYKLTDSINCAKGPVIYTHLNPDTDTIHKLSVYASPESGPSNGAGNERYSPKYETEIPLRMFDTVGWHNLHIQAVYNQCTTKVNAPHRISIRGAVVSAKLVKDCSHSWDSVRLHAQTKIQCNEDVSWEIFEINHKGEIVRNIHQTNAKLTDTIPYKFSKPGFYAAAINVTNDSACSHADTIMFVIEHLEVGIRLKNYTYCLADATIDMQHYELYGNTGLEHINNKTLTISGPGFDSLQTFAVNRNETLAVEDLTLSKPGKYLLTLSAKDRYGCTVSTTASMKIYQPTALISTKDTIGCLPIHVTYSNLSTGDTALKAFHWQTNADDIVSQTTYSVDEAFSAKYSTKDSIKTTITAETVAINSTGATCKSTFVLSGTVLPIIPKVDFTYDDKICLGTEMNITRKEIVAEDEVSWKFKDDDEWLTKDSSTFTHTYTEPGEYTVSLRVGRKTDYGYCVNEASGKVDVRNFNAKISVIEPANKCFIKAKWMVQPEVISTVPGVEYNLYKDGQLFTNYSNFPAQYEFLNSPGSHIAKLEMLTPYVGCRRMVDSIRIDALGANIDFEIMVDDTIVCVGETFKVRFINTQNLQLTGFEWVFGDGSTNTTDTIVEIAYDTVPANGKYNIRVFQGTECAGYILENGKVVGELKPFVSKPINLHRIESRFIQNGTWQSIAGCPPFGVSFVSESFGQNEMWWDFGNGQTSQSTSPDSVYYPYPGTYTASLRVKNDKCDHTIKKTLTVYTDPIAKWSAKESVNCEDDDASILASAEGDYTYQWDPADLLDDAGRLNPIYLSADTTRIFHVTATNTFGCSIEDSVKLTVQNRPYYSGAPKDSISYKRSDEYIRFRPTDTLIVLENYMLGNDSLANIKYKWTPASYLSCDTCANPVISIPDGVETIHYSVRMADIYGCFDQTEELNFTVIKNTMAALPDAFTPNGDGHNDVLYLRGWAIRQLIELRVYNRLGQVVFETDDINRGWDGTFNGKDQPADIYAYVFKIITFGNEEKTYKGDFKLVR